MRWKPGFQRIARQGIVFAGDLTVTNHPACTLHPAWRYANHRQCCARSPDSFSAEAVQPPAP
jgi:hypothetical protein